MRVLASDEDEETTPRRRGKVALRVELIIIGIGRVLIQMEPSGDGVLLELAADEEAALRHLRLALPEIADAVRRAGLRLVRCRLSRQLHAQRVHGNYPMQAGAASLSLPLFRAMAEVALLLTQPEAEGPRRPIRWRPQHPRERGGAHHRLEGSGGAVRLRLWLRGRIGPRRHRAAAGRRPGARAAAAHRRAGLTRHKKTAPEAPFFILPHRADDAHFAVFRDFVVRQHMQARREQARVAGQQRTDLRQTSSSGGVACCFICSRATGMFTCSCDSRCGSIG